MLGSLQHEIGKKQPFSSPEEEAALSLMRTADRLMGYCDSQLKSVALTSTQYNVLRILRGMSPEPISCQEIARRMITRDADLTRLLDRLECRGLLARGRQSGDRRVVHIQITPSGLELLARLDQVMTEMNRGVFGDFPRRQLADLIAILEQVRAHLEQPKVST
jgi:DNA-binding MarR family transcriptional regulator